MINQFGKHMIVNTKGSFPDLIDSETNIRNFVNTLIKEINMTKYGDCVIKKFGKDPRLAGYSFFQLIEESNVSGHFCPYDYIMNDKDGKSYNNKGASYIDIFSCKDYDPEIVLDVIKMYFKPESFTYQVIDRF